MFNCTIHRVLSCLCPTLNKHKMTHNIQTTMGFKFQFRHQTKNSNEIKCWSPISGFQFIPGITWYRWITSFLLINLSINQSTTDWSNICAKYYARWNIGNFNWINNLQYKLCHIFSRSPTSDVQRVANRWIQRRRLHAICTSITEKLAQRFAFNLLSDGIKY